MSFHNTNLPTFLLPYLVGKISFSTSIALSASGSELRTSDCLRAKHRYSLKDCRLSQVDFESFSNFFKARRGSRFSFLLKDFMNYIATKQIVAVGDGEQKSFQLYKTYDDDSNHQYIHTITKLKQDTIKIFMNDIEQINGFEINLLSGIVTLSYDLQKDTIFSASFEFYITVRFSLDFFEYEQKEDGSIEIMNVEFIEVFE